MTHRLSLAHIEQAMTVIDPVFLRTPQYRVESLDGALGCRLVVKVETLNPVSCFKGRGASYLLASVPTGTRLICASAGNFGQAMAYACRSKGVQLIVYASVNANPFKVGRMRDLGAEVRLWGDDFDAAKIEARRVAQAHGIHMVEDGLDPATGEGAGTIGLELAQWTEPLDAVLVALGNGAMITGVGLWLKEYSPGDAGGRRGGSGGSLNGRILAFRDDRAAHDGRHDCRWYWRARPGSRGRGRHARDGGRRAAGAR